MSMDSRRELRAVSPGGAAAASRAALSLCALALLSSAACVDAAWAQSPQTARRDAGGPPPRVGLFAPVRGATGRGGPGLQLSAAFGPLGDEPTQTREQVRAESARRAAEEELATATSRNGEGVSGAVPPTPAEAGGSIAMAPRAPPPRALISSTTEASGPGAEALPVIRASLLRVGGRYRLCFERQADLGRVEATLRFVIPADASVHVPSPAVEMTLPPSVTAQTRACLQRNTAWVILYTRIAREAAVVHTLRWQR